MSDRLKAWVHYKRKDDLSEDDSLFVDDIESLIIENRKLRKILKKTTISARFFSNHADCKWDSWACKCEFCRDDSASIDLNKAEKYLKESKELRE